MRLEAPGCNVQLPGWLDSGAGDGPDLWPGIMGEAGRKQWLGVGRCSSLGRGISGHCPAAGGGRQEQRFHAGGTRVSSSSFPHTPFSLSLSLRHTSLPPPPLPPRRPSRVSTPSHPPGAQRVVGGQSGRVTQRVVVGTARDLPQLHTVQAAAAIWVSSRTARARCTFLGR